MSKELAKRGPGSLDPASKVGLKVAGGSLGLVTGGTAGAGAGAALGFVIGGPPGAAIGWLAGLFVGGGGGGYGGAKAGAHLAKTLGE